jgi:hypothetical protein
MSATGLALRTPFAAALLAATASVGYAQTREETPGYSSRNHAHEATGNVGAGS